MRKYRSRPVKAFGMSFASRAECARYIVLRDQEAREEIFHLKFQPRFDLGAGITYVADFSYDRNGKTVVEDVKGFETAVFRLKKRLYEARYGKLTVVKMKSRDVDNLMRAHRIV